MEKIEVIRNGQTNEFSVVLSRGMTKHPNSLTTLGYPLGNLAFRWFLADEVPARPKVELVKAADAPTAVS